MKFLLLLFLLTVQVAGAVILKDTDTVVPIPPQTDWLELRLFDYPAKLRTSIIVVVDGVTNRVDGMTGGTNGYVLRYRPTWGYFGARTGHTRRLGEGASSYTVRVELGGSTDKTTFTLTGTESPAPFLPFHNSVAFDAATDAQEVAGDGVLSVTHTATGANLAAFLAVASIFNPPPTCTATYAGAAMTELWDAGFSSQYASASYALAGIASGAQTVTGTLSSGAPTEQYVGVISMTGVDQSTPVGTAVTSQTFTDPATVTVGSVGTDDLVVDALFGENFTSLTIGADQTLRNSETITTREFRMSSQPGTAGGVMSWATTGGADTYHIGAVAFKPSVGGAAAPVQRRRAFIFQ